MSRVHAMPSVPRDAVRGSGFVVQQIIPINNISRIASGVSKFAYFFFLHTSRCASREGGKKSEKFNDANAG